MTIEERLEAVERELAHQNEMRGLREINEKLAASQANRTEAQLAETKKALPKLEAAMKELEDANIVTAAQTARHETRAKEHREWLEQMELAFARMAASHEVHKREMAEIREADAERGRKLDERIDQIAKADAGRGRALDQRIDKLVSAIGELIRARNGHQ